MSIMIKQVHILEDKNIKSLQERINSFIKEHPTYSIGEIRLSHYGYNEYNVSEVLSVPHFVSIIIYTKKFTATLRKKRETEEQSS